MKIFTYKNIVICLLLLGYIKGTSQYLKAQRAPEASTLIPQKGDWDARVAWWNNARFGMFIHWGVYSTLSGTWQGVQ